MCTYIYIYMMYKTIMKSLNTIVSQLKVMFSGPPPFSDPPLGDGDFMLCVLVQSSREQNEIRRHLDSFTTPSGSR